MSNYFSPDNLIPEERSLPLTIAQEVLRKIFTGEMKLGSRITESSIAKQLNVSNIPVREAFSILQSTGVIEKIPHKGVRIREITKKEIRDYEVALILLYKNCIDLAESKWSREKLDLMKNALIDIETELNSNNLYEYINKCDRICRYVIVVSENVAMLRFYNDITYITNAYCQSNWNDLDRLRKRYDLLVQMVDALGNGDNQDAKDHFEEMTHDFLKITE